MQKYSPSLALIVKGDKLNQSQSPKNELKYKQIQNILYSSVVGRLMYASICTRLAISFMVGILSQYQSNLWLDHWKETKKVMCYL